MSDCAVGCESSCLMVVPAMLGTRPFMLSSADAVSEECVERVDRRESEVLAVPRVDGEV